MASGPTRAHLAILLAFATGQAGCLYQHPARVHFARRSSVAGRAFPRSAADYQPEPDLLEALRLPSSWPDELAEEPGHVFVVQGDLRKLSADAVLYPTRSTDNVLWFPDGVPEGTFAPPHSAFTEEQRVHKLQVPDSGMTSAQPQVWLAQLNSKFAPVPQPNTPLSWFLAAAEQFLTSAYADIVATGRKPNNNRVRHLLALPVVGTGPKNAREVSGDILTALLGTLYAFAYSAEMDVVLVVKSPRMFSAAQASRRQLAASDVELARRQLKTARRLARLATAGQLALFLGAGASAGAGLPEWNQLLLDLAVGKLKGEAEISAFSRLSTLDQALVLERRLGGPEQLQTAVCAALRTSHHSLSHALLAALPVDGVVTTNYDDLFETACQGAQVPFNVLPYQPGWASAVDDPATSSSGGGGGGGASSVATRSRASKRWILKLHGCVHHPQDIVLTRTQMNEYSDRRQALTGIVQTMLITKHMLFVGFSLRDENFHKVATTVNKAIAGYANPGSHPNGSLNGHAGAGAAGPASGAAAGAVGPAAAGATAARGAGANRAVIGTVITLHYRPFLDDLWPQLALVPMEAEESLPLGHCARKLEIFLDRVSLLASTTSGHLLDANFDGTFSPQEHALREELLDFRRRLLAKPEARKASAYRLVRDMLVALGDDERGSAERTLFDAWANEDIENDDFGEPWGENNLIQK